MTAIDWTKPVYNQEGRLFELNATGYKNGVTIERRADDPKNNGRTMRYGWLEGMSKGDGDWYYEDGASARKGRHVLSNHKPIDWSLPIELDDGTPLEVVQINGYTVNVRLSFYGKHPAFPGAGNKGYARRECGLVGSNHKYHVRNRTMTTFKVGDRVRYHARRSPDLFAKDNGRTAVVREEASSPTNIRICWDDTGVTGGVYPQNLDLINMIDTAKPLEIYAPDGREAGVPFITETSEGHILVGGNRGRGGVIADALDWIIFNKEGQFVRGSGADPATGRALCLRNKAVTRVVYQLANAGRVKGTTSAFVPTVRPYLKVTLVDEVVDSVELVK